MAFLGELGTGGLLYAEHCRKAPIDERFDVVLRQPTALSLGFMKLGPSGAPVFPFCLVQGSRRK